MTRSVILVADSPGPSGEGPWRELEARCEVMGLAARRVTLVGFWPGQVPAMPALAGAGAALLDVMTPDDLVVAIGQHVARALLLDGKSPLSVSPTISSGFGSWVPLPRAPWWSQRDNRDRSRYWLLRWCGADPLAEVRTSSVLVPTEIPEHPAPRLAAVEEWHVANAALSAVHAVTGAPRSFIASAQGRSGGPKIVMARHMVAWLARGNNCRERVVARVLNATPEAVRHMVKRFQERLNEPAVVAMSVQATLAFEAIDSERLKRRLPEDKDEAA